MVKPYYLLSEKYKLAFLEIPKTGSTSIREAIECAPDRHSEKPEGFTSFTLLRNPKDRFLSGYHEALRRGTFKGSLLELLQAIKEQGFSIDNHIAPQKDYFQPVDYLAFNRSTLEIWLGVKLGHKNKTENPQDHWTKASESLFNELYKEDIQFYNELRK